MLLASNNDSVLMTVTSAGLRLVSIAYEFGAAFRGINLPLVLAVTFHMFPGHESADDNS